MKTARSQFRPAKGPTTHTPVSPIIIHAMGYIYIRFLRPKQIYDWVFYRDRIIMSYTTSVLLRTITGDRSKQDRIMLV